MREMVVAFVGRHASPSTVRIGNERDNLAERIRFELPVKGSAVLHLQHGAYSDIVGLEDGVYSPTRMQTQYPGKWTAYIEVMAEGDMVWHSDAFALLIGALPRDGEQIEQEYPTLFEDALNAAAALAQIEPAAETLPEGSAATVRREANVDGSSRLVFGIPRGNQGRPGDKGERGLQGPRGPRGETGKGLTIRGYYATLDALVADVVAPDVGDPYGVGTSAPYDIYVYTEDGWVNNGPIQGPAGLQGEPGKDGKPGTPGKDGSDGKDGQDGYTPQRGVDYWTEADKQAMVQDVLAALPDGEVVSY